MTKLQSPCLWRVTFLLLCRATSGKPIFVNSERRSSMSGAVYSTNSNPSVPIGLAKPVTVVSSARQLRLAKRHFKHGETQQTQQTQRAYACVGGARAKNAASFARPKSLKAGHRPRLKRIARL